MIVYTFYCIKWIATNYFSSSNVSKCEKCVTFEEGSIKYTKEKFAIRTIFGRRLKINVVLIINDLQ